MGLCGFLGDLSCGTPRTLRLGERGLAVIGRRELELELIQPHMAQKQVLRGEVECACVARVVSWAPCFSRRLNEMYLPHTLPTHSFLKSHFI